MINSSFQSLKGIDVKRKYGPLYKVMKDDLYHKGFQYKQGINIDTKPFRFGGFCTGHGLYFSNFQHIHNFLFYGSMIAEVSILDDEDVWMETDRNGLQSFKSHQLIILDVKPVINMDWWICPNFGKRLWSLLSLDVQSAILFLVYLENTEILEQFFRLMGPNTKNLLSEIKNAKNVIAKNCGLYSFPLQNESIGKFYSIVKRELRIVETI